MKWKPTPSQLPHGRNRHIDSFEHSSNSHKELWRQLLLLCRQSISERNLYLLDLWSAANSHPVTVIVAHWSISAGQLHYICSCWTHHSFIHSFLRQPAGDQHGVSSQIHPHENGLHMIPCSTKLCIKTPPQLMQYCRHPSTATLTHPCCSVQIV